MAPIRWPNQIWTLRDVQDATDMVRQGWTVAEIAEAFGTSLSETEAFLLRNRLLVPREMVSS